MPSKRTLSLAAYCLPIIRNNLEALLRERKGIRAGVSIEPLHRMRVASRRMRTSLWLFKRLYAPAQRAYLRTEIKAVTRSLGKARDIDTHLAFLASIKDTTPGIITLRHQLGAQRAKQQKKVLQRIQNLDAPCLRNGISRFNKARDIAPGDILAKKIRKRLRQLLAFEKHGYNPQDLATLHRMRIAAKHLRYALEQSQPFFRTRINRFIIQAKVLHDTLGDVHNYHVWGEDARKSGIPGIQRLLAVCRKREKNAYAAFRLAWKKQQASGIWKSLEELCA